MDRIGSDSDGWRRTPLSSRPSCLGLGLGLGGGSTATKVEVAGLLAEVAAATASTSSRVQELERECSSMRRAMAAAGSFMRPWPMARELQASLEATRRSTGVRGEAPRYAVAAGGSGPEESERREERKKEVGPTCRVEIEGLRL